MVTGVKGSRTLFWLPDEYSMIKDAVRVTGTASESKTVANVIAGEVVCNACTDEVWNLLFPDKERRRKDNAGSESVSDGSVQASDDCHGDGRVRDVHAEEVVGD